MITLEKIDQIVERTGVTYEEAKEALQAVDGDVVEAIIYLEKNKKTMFSNINVKSGELMENLKEILKKGNVTKVIVEKDGEVLLNLPVSVGAIGLVLAPVAAIIGVGAALVVKYTIKIVKDDGEEINVNALTEEKLNYVKEKVNFSKKDSKDEKDVTEEVMKEADDEDDEPKE